MRSNTICVLFLVLVCAAFCEAASVDNHAVVHLKQQAVDSSLFGNTKRLIEELVDNLCVAAKQVAGAMVTFATGLKDQVKLFQEKIEVEIGQLKDGVMQSITGIMDKFTNAGAGFKECIEINKKKADQLFNDAMYKTMSCADGKVEEVGDLISRQVDMSREGIEFANNVLEEMRNCTEGTNIITKGVCLASVALKTEMKKAAFLTQSAISIAHIDIALVTLPVSLDICAGKRLVEAGMGTANIIMDIGKCSASSVFTTVTGFDVVPSSNAVPDVNGVPNVNAVPNANGVPIVNYLPTVNDVLNVNDVPNVNIANDVPADELNVPAVTNASNFN